MHRGKYRRTFIATAVGVAAVGFAAILTRKKARRTGKQSIIPLLNRTVSGRAGKLERFSHYVARQLGFGDANDCANLCKLANDYLRRTEGCEDKIYDFFCDEPDGERETIYVKLLEEMDRCVLSYFAFHWSHASLMITQNLDLQSEKPMLREVVMAATRKLRFEKVTRSLKATRLFSTLVEEMKAIAGDGRCTEVMAPVAHSKRSPVLLLMGGGMGAGKSTVMKDIMKESFWAEAAASAVVVEADAFKEQDVIYRALSSRGCHDDMLQTAELVHQSSTDAASSLLVTALNEGRDVIMDGTLSWEPFVRQTIAMTRDVHRRRYRMGTGYVVSDDGTVFENYWEAVERAGDEGDGKPYRIELVGVVCDAYLAVVRGIRRAILTGRAVRVNSQLKSHKRFARAFPVYCHLVDNARLYCTNSAGCLPKLIGWKDGESGLLVDQDEIGCLTMVSELNENAQSVYELYPGQEDEYGRHSIWNDVVSPTDRPDLQAELRTCIQRIENLRVASP